MDEHLIDKRVIQRHLNKGKVDPKDYRRLLESLPDLSDRVVRSVAPPDDSAEGRTQAEPAAQS